MKKLITILLLIILNSMAFSQSGYRMKLLRNLNSYPLSGPAYSALWGYTATNGREYAILGCYNGTSFVDITDTTNIHEVDYLPLPPGVIGSIWREMKTYSHYAYIVSEANNSNIQIVDLAFLPDSIRYVGKIVLGNHSTTHTISQSGPYLYLNGCNASLTQGVAVLDLTINPELPVLRGTWSERYIHDSRIVNDSIWSCNISDGRITVIDARNKDSLKTIRSWVNLPQPNAPHNVALTIDRRYAFVTDEVFDPPGRTKIWNVTDLDNITYIKSIDPTPFEDADVHNIEIHNNYAFLAYYAAGVKVYNISDPENPVELCWYDTYPEDNFGTGCWAVYYFPSGKIIASDMIRGLFVLKPNLNNPVPSIPHANFMASKQEVLKRDSIRLIDMTEEVPVSWQWTVTGPQTKTSTLRHPKFAFQTLGYYSVSLKVTNSFGSDSVYRPDVFRVRPAPLASFSIVSPVGNPFFPIIVSQSDTNKVLFNWTKSVDDPDIYYKMNFKKVNSPNEIYYNPGNNGRDTFALISKSELYSIAYNLGFNGDSVIVQYRVRAYDGTDSVSTGIVLLVLKRSSVGIQNIGNSVPNEYRLYNNFPNPFNPVTNIIFDIPERNVSGNGIVKLILFDILGREVSTLINQTLDAGSYKFILNAGSYTSGIYFVRLISDDYDSAIRILLLK